MATTSFIINEFTGSDAQVQVTLTDVGTGIVQVNLEVVSGFIADITGFFANFNNNFTVSEAVSIGLVSETPGNLTSTSETSNGAGILFLDDSGLTTDGITDVDSNVNLNGQGTQRTFELGVQFGSGGLVGGADDFRSVTFNLTAPGLDISDFETVGVRLQSVGPNRDGSSKLEGVPGDTLTPAIAIVKLTNGADGITLLEGSAVTWTYAMTNTGNVSLANLTVTDDQGVVPVYASGDDGDGLFEAGETWLYKASGTAIADDYSNIGTATGNYNGKTVTASDPSSYFGATPKIDVEKLVSVDGGATWVDADTVTGPVLLSGTNPQFKFVVTNTGNVALSNVILTDSDFNLDGLSGDATGGNNRYDIGTLAAGGSKEIVFTGAPWQAGQHTNTATTSGSFTDGAGQTATPSDQDDANYFGANPKIDVEKLVSVNGGATWVDADTVTGPFLLTGFNPQFKFVVTNTGNVALSNVTLTDSDFNLDGISGDATGGNSRYDIGTLAAGGSKEIVFTGATWQAGQHTNTATTSGSFTDGAGQTATPSDKDDANYFGAKPSIDVEKLVSVNGGATWVDADTVTGPFLLTGFNPQFKFVVTNTGNVALANITLSDDKLDLNGAAAGTSLAINSLAAGGTFETILTGVWQSGQHTNLATVATTYTDDGGNQADLTDSDAANYFGANPGIDVEKFVSVDGGVTWFDADTATGPFARDPRFGGLNPQFRFVVQNTGNVALTNIILSDDKFDLNGAAAGTTIAIAALAANNGMAGGADEFVFTFTGATWQAGQHTNTATVSAAYTDGGGNTANLSDRDAANYFGVSGPGVGTPGFWGQWTATWDGNTSNDSTFNTRTNFVKADILYQVTDPVTGQLSTANSGTTSANRGILIGDFNRDGITNAGENTIYYTVAEAQAILSASNQVQGQDARYTLGRQLIASWFNFLAGNPIAPVEVDIKNAVTWLQNNTPNEGGTAAGDGSLTVSASTFRVPSSSDRWSTTLGTTGSGLRYGSQIKDVLDEYNNTGAGFAIDRDTSSVGGNLTTNLTAYRPFFGSPIP